MNIDNFFDEDVLVPNLKAAAFFILMYEHFEDIIISTVRDLHSSPCMLDGAFFYDIDDDYIKLLKSKIANGEKNDGPVPLKILLGNAIRAKETYNNNISVTEKTDEKDGKKFKGSLKWLQAQGVITNSEREYILAIRNRRNTVVHELFAVISAGFTTEDANMMSALIQYNKRINNWFFREIDAYLSDPAFLGDSSVDDIMGIDDMILMSAFRILFLAEGDRYKKAIETFDSILDKAIIT